MGETTFRLIDTAGLRRMRKHRQQVEYWSQVRALHAAQHADIALVLVDAQEGLTDQDLHVADEARKAGCATIVVVSKWDIQEVDLDDLRERLQIKLRQRPVVITSSAVTGRGVERVLRTIEDVYGHYTSRLGTGELNRLLQGGGRAPAGAADQAAPPEAALRRAGADAPAAVPHHRQRPQADHRRLRVLPREPHPRGGLAGVVPGDRRLRRALILTFDDGPDPRFTPQVLDVLGEAGVQARFYCVGRRALAWPDLVRRIDAEGHVVGSHTMTHPDLSKLDPLAAMNNIRAGKRAVEQALGGPVRGSGRRSGGSVSRGASRSPPCGSSTTTGTSTPRTGRPTPTPQALFAKLRHLGPDAVVLLHDGAESPADPAGLDRSQTVAALRLLFGL